MHKQVSREELYKEDEDEEGTPHEEVMEEMRQYCAELDARGRARR